MTSVQIGNQIGKLHVQGEEWLVLDDERRPRAERVGDASETTTCAQKR